MPGTTAACIVLGIIFCMLQWRPGEILTGAINHSRGVLHGSYKKITLVRCPTGTILHGENEVCRDDINVDLLVPAGTSTRLGWIQCGFKVQKNASGDHLPLKKNGGAQRQISVTLNRFYDNSPRQLHATAPVACNWEARTNTTQTWEKTSYTKT
jgi:hypothetical protein